MSSGRERGQALAESAGLGLIGHAAQARAPGFLKGPAALASDATLAAVDLATTGRVSSGTMAGAAASAATMVGARLIPGVGWAMLAYTAADLGSRAVLGKPFGETWVGRPIDWAAGTLGRGAIGVATAATDAVGWTGASDFLNKTVYPWAFGSEAPKAGFLRGPETAMTADDWYEHPPGKNPSSGLTATDLPGIAPNGDDVTARRARVLAADEQAIGRERIAEEIGIPGGTDRAALLRAALELTAGDDEDDPPAPRRTQGREIDE